MGTTYTNGWVEEKRNRGLLGSSSLPHSRGAFSVFFTWTEGVAFFVQTMMWSERNGEVMQKKQSVEKNKWKTMSTTEVDDYCESLHDVSSCLQPKSDARNLRQDI